LPPGAIVQPYLQALFLPKEYATANVAQSLLTVAWDCLAQEFYDVLIVDCARCLNGAKVYILSEGVAPKRQNTKK
jgi:hypothetical protein